MLQNPPRPQSPPHDPTLPAVLLRNTYNTSVPQNSDAVLYLFHLLLMDIHVFSPKGGYVP